jgi:hypothetical protein
MNPFSIAKFVENNFTSFPFLVGGLGGCYDMIESEVFGSSDYVLPCLLFYASIHVCGEYLDIATLTNIFNEKIRRAVHPVVDSVLSLAEEDFTTDLMNIFPVTQNMNFKDLKKMIISRVMIREDVATAELARGKALFEKVLKGRPELSSQETVSDFVSAYISNGASILARRFNMMDSMYLLLDLFASLNAPVPGRLTKPFGWCEKLCSRLHVVYLVRKLVTRNVGIQSITPADRFSAQLEDFSKQIDSPPRSAYAVPQVWAPLIHPQKSPGSPDSFRLSPKPSPPRLSGPLAFSLAGTSRPTTKSQREIVVEALQHAGMSPKRSVKAADEFLAGGPNNLEALQDTIAQSYIHPIAEPNADEKSKLGDIQSMMHEIRSLAAVRINTSSRS